MSTSSINSDSSLHTAVDWDTGFPDSFAAVTTSRRHPEARVGSLAIIEADDFDHQHSLDRKKNILFMKYRRTISHGKIRQLEPLAESPDGDLAQTDAHSDDTGSIQDRPISPQSTSSRGKSDKLRGIFKWRGN